MLVLTRRAGEYVTFDDDIVYRVIKIRGSQVHIGFMAPGYFIHRRVVYDRIMEGGKNFGNGRGGSGMLVLTFRAGESVMIGHNIEVKVLKFSGSQIHLGQEAPREVAMHRGEVYERIYGGLPPLLEQYLERQVSQG